MKCVPLGFPLKQNYKMKIKDTRSNKMLIFRICLREQSEDTKTILHDENLLYETKL